MPLRVRDDGGDYAAFFTVPAATGLARLIFTLGWHLACSQGEAARVLLGMSAATAAVIAGYTLCQIDALAVCRAGWLRPRWPTRVRVWRELLAAAAQGETPALERARLRGLTLLAAEISLAPRHGGAGMPARAGRAA